LRKNDDLMKTIIFLTGLYFLMKRHSNCMDLSINTIIYIKVKSKIHTEWEILIPSILRS